MTSDEPTRGEVPEVVFYPWDQTSDGWDVEVDGEFIANGVCERHDVETLLRWLRSRGAIRLRIEERK